MIQKSVSYAGSYMGLHLISNAPRSSTSLYETPCATKENKRKLNPSILLESLQLDLISLGQVKKYINIYT